MTNLTNALIKVKKQSPIHCLKASQGHLHNMTMT